MKKSIFITFLMLLPMLASANDGDTFSGKTVEGVLLKYTIISESEKTCMVGDKYESPIPTSNSSVSRVPKANDSQLSGDITIPEVANGYTVIRIEDYAFMQAAITSVFIPNSIKTIGSAAFMLCVDLKSVRLPEQLTKIEGNTFDGCESLSSIDIPEGVTSIGDYAFANCKQLKEITIPSSVENYGKNVFWNTGFTSLPKLPESLITIPNGMFYECTQLTSIEIPQNITRIDDTAFGRCPISELEIPASVVNIGVAAFANCKNLTNIVIPDNVMSIGMNGFLGCSGLKTVKLSNNLSNLSKGVFSDCTNLESIIIPSGVKTIGLSAFQGCSSLRSISIPETVEEIDELVFSGCSSLTQLVIPKSVINIKVEEHPLLYGCNGLTSIIVDEDNPVYDSRNNCNAIIETASNKIIVGCTTTTIPEGITTIGTYALSGFQNLTSMTLPQSLKNIEGGAFNWLGLKEINIPENVTFIAPYAFSCCKQLETVKSYIKEPYEISEKAFFESTSVATLYVPQGTVDKYKATKGWGAFSSIRENTEPNNNTAYRQLVEEGKHWTYDNFLPDRPAKYNHYYYYDLRGDTLIAGKNSLKLYSDNRYNDSIVKYEGAFYEENKKVYCFYPEKEEAVLLYDFDCEVGDTIHVKAGNMVVKDIQTEDNGGIPIKKYTFQNNVIWIEGVGAMMDFFAMVPFMGNYNSLNACELNGEKLYHTVAPKTIMVTEGKRWNYIHYYIDEDGEHRDPYSYVVKGDTIINRTFYKKLWYQDEKTEKLVCILFEAGHEIFKKYDNSYMTSFFDFGREDFGRVFTWKAKNASGNTNWMVYGVDTIEVNNRPFRRYTCLQKYSKENEKLTTIEYDGKGVWHDIWVEGVGSASSGIEDQNPLHEPPVKTTSDYTYFVSCYENGECIFTADDFNIQPFPKPDINMAYYYYEGNKIPLTLNENKVVVSIPKDCGEITERFRANVQTLFMINDEAFDIYVIPQSEYEKLTTLDFWEKDAKSIVLTSSYFTESNEEVFATPYLNVKLKKEEDIDLLTSYAEQYKLTIVGNSAFMPLWYILAVTPESGKSPLECANELYESGDFAASIPDLASDIFPQTAYRPFVEDGKVWQVGSVNSGNPVQWVEYFYFDGDTIIDGKTCKQMMCQRYVSPDYPEYDYISQQPSLSYVGAWYEEDKKVYEYDSTNQQFKLMYDFSVDDNATLQINGQSYVIGPRQTGGIKGFKGVYRDVMMCKEGGGTVWSTPWLEGVGGIYGMTTNVIDGELADPEWFLMSCTVGDEVIYFNDEYEDGATPEGMNAKKRFDFTHTIKTQPKAPMRRVAEQSLYGEYNNQQLGINLNSLEDAYLVRITDKTGKVVYEKDINAGNIVGLNINISTYGDGRYTVTMENNHESFTGEFEVQTSGIEEVRNNHEMIKGYIYNLQGQRISTLQKGLNIVNGRKIYVK